LTVIQGPKPELRRTQEFLFAGVKKLSYEGVKNSDQKGRERVDTSRERKALASGGHAVASFLP